MLMAQSLRKALPLPSPNPVTLRRELQYATTQGMSYIQSMAAPLLLCAIIASLPISESNLNCPLICKVGIIRRPVSPGRATGWYWNIAQTEGKSLSLISARSGWWFCCRPGASAIMPPSPTCLLFWSRSFISVSRASSSFGGSALPIRQGHFGFSSLSFTALTTLPKSVCAFHHPWPWWMPDHSGPGKALPATV